jgi:hypothetical protein
MAIEVKVGDVVHVRGIVVGIHSNGIAAIDFYVTDTAGPPHQGYGVAQAAIVHVESPPLKVGETVQHGSVDWTVLAIDGEMLWIKKMSANVLHISVHRDEVQRYS